MPADTSQIFEKLGAIQAGVDFAKTELVHAREDRGKLYAKIEDQATRLKSIEDYLAEIKPVVENFRQLRWKVGGAVFVLLSLGAVMGALVSFFATEIKSIIFRLTI